MPKLQVKGFYGNFLVVLKALTYMMTLGAEGIREACEGAVLNANYMMAGLRDLYPVAYGQRCMHEFVLSLEQLKKETGISALDVAKSLIDYGIHPPTMYFPLIVHEALMFEPTETNLKKHWMKPLLFCVLCMNWLTVMQEQMHPGTPSCPDQTAR